MRAERSNTATFPDGLGRKGVTEDHVPGGCQCKKATTLRPQRKDGRVGGMRAWRSSAATCPDRGRERIGQTWEIRERGSNGVRQASRDHDDLVNCEKGEVYGDRERTGRDKQKGQAPLPYPLTLDPLHKSAARDW